MNRNHSTFVPLTKPDDEARGQAWMPPHSSASRQGPLTEAMAWDELKTIYDPEIPVNIVDLGLIYALRIVPLEGGNRIELEMTLTAPGCAMSDVLKSTAESKLAGLPEVREVQVRVVFDPPWSRERMSESARLQLGIE